MNRNFCVTYWEIIHIKEVSEKPNGNKNCLLKKNSKQVILNIPENSDHHPQFFIFCKNLLNTIFTSALLISPVLSRKIFQSWISYSSRFLFPTKFILRSPLRMKSNPTCIINPNMVNLEGYELLGEPLEGEDHVADLVSIM